MLVVGTHINASTGAIPRVVRYEAARRRIARVLAAFVTSGMLVVSAGAVAQSRADVDALTSTKPSRAQGTAAGQPNIAFFYGALPPVGALQAFDAVVLDPSKGFDPAAHPLAHTTWVARVGADSSDAAVAPDAFIADTIAPLWQHGYRGFLLETPAAIAAIDRIHALHPEARLIVGGDDALAAALPHATALYAVVGQPFVRTLDDASQTQLQTVPEAERTSRIAADQAFHERTGVPVVSVELCDRTDRQCARRTAAQVLAAGVTPYVTSPARDIVGVGRIEVLPRKILIVQDGYKNSLDMSPGVRNLAMPLNYLGYDVEYADLNSPLPQDVTPDRYAGVVAWIEGGDARDPIAWQHWVIQRMADHIPVAFMDHFGFDAAGMDGAVLDLQPVAGQIAEPVSVVKRDPMIGFEIDPKPDVRDLQGVRVGPHSRALLTLSANGALIDEVGVTPWGGYALNPYTVVWLEGIEQKRWAIQPIDFMKAALRLKAMPSPSVTTENGRRLFMTHVDGDGFASRAEFPGPDYSGEALYEQIFSHFHVPMTLSVIEGEVGPAGLHPDISPRLEAIARKMFALPNVEIGSHTYSHPFEWENVDSRGARDDGGGDSAFSLNIPGYKFDLDREIGGSIDYINSRLAPSGKRTEVLQWSGNCRPPAIAVRKAYEAGVYNFNGGDTYITNSINTWSAIAPIGVDKGPGAYQVYAPNQDENVYTNDWQGPFYGFTQVLETFAMTDKPLRFKPIDIYYHMYSGTKVASLHALNGIFTAVLKQPVMPVYVSDYIRKVLDWRSFAVAREILPNGDEGDWVVRGNGAITELHWAQNSAPSIDTASGLTGFWTGTDGVYVHFDGGAARFAFAGTPTRPYISEANGVVRQFTRTANGMRFQFAGHYEPFVKLANAQRCQVTLNGQPAAVHRDGDFMRFDTPASIERQMTFQSVELNCAG